MKTPESKRVAVLRSNPSDFAFWKVLMALRNRYGVDCYIWDRRGDYDQIALDENIRFRRFRVQAGFYNVGTFLKLLLFELWLFIRLLFARVNYIHSIDLDTGLIGFFVAKLRGKPFIYQCLDPYYLNLPPQWPKFLGKWAKKMETRLISAADLFIITDRLRLSQHEGANPKRVAEFANVPSAVVSDLEEQSNGEFVVGYIGALVEGRNLMTIIDALGELEQEGIRLVVGGYGPLDEVIAEACRKYKNIDYMGWIPLSRHNQEVLNLESSFDAFIYTNDPDNDGQKWVSPNKLFESMALGKPIVVSEGTLVAERVSSVGNGIMVKYGSKKELQSAILRLKNGPGLVREMGEKGKNEYTQNWTWEIMEKRLLDAYRELGAF